MRALVPILHTYLFFAGSSDTDDIALRNSASFGLVRIATRVKEDVEKGDMTAHEELLAHIIYPGVKRAMKVGEKYCNTRVCVYRYM